MKEKGKDRHLTLLIVGGAVLRRGRLSESVALALFGVVQVSGAFRQLTLWFVQNLFITSRIIQCVSSLSISFVPIHHQNFSLYANEGFLMKRFKSIDLGVVELMLPYLLDS